MIDRVIIRLVFIGASLAIAACSFDKSGVSSTIDSGTVDAMPSIDAPITECIGQAEGTPCGDSSSTECSAPDTCDGEGNCIPNHVAAAMACGDATDNECNGADTCDGAGVCVDNIQAVGTACGDTTNSECDGADTCDGAGACVDNIQAAGTACGDTTNNTCDGADTCDGAGICETNLAMAGTACGDGTPTDCSSPDSCDGSGTCMENHLPDATSCDDCSAGMPYCDDCAAGVCENIACNVNVCVVDDDCTPAMTGGTCADAADDCVTTGCIGGVPPIGIDAGAPAGTDFNTWQEDDELTLSGGDRWYCNVDHPILSAGVLTDWTVDVVANGNNGETAQMLVIRCSVGGGGNMGPVLSGCSRVGIGPASTIAGNGIVNFSLANATQLDTATVDNTGIVVEAGDYICTQSLFYNIAIDCNGSDMGGGCPGPTFNTQFGFNMDTASEPFTLANSTRDGTLMIKATGMSYEVEGTCSDTVALPDETSCADNGDTCCAGTCTDTGGGGTCS